MVSNVPGFPWKHPEEDIDWRQFSKAMLNASINGIVALDTRGQAVISNKKAQDTMGFFPGTRQSTTLPEISKAASQILNKKVSVLKVPVKRKEKSYLVRISPIVVKQKILGLFCIFQDVTAFENVTDKMNAYQELSIELDTLIDSSTDGLWICDGKGDVLRINSASERLTNVKAADVIGKNMREIVADGLIDNSVTLKVLETKKRSSIIQKTRNGKKLFLTGNPVFDKDTGEMFRIVVNERDITEITWLQEELEKKEALNEQFKQNMLEMQIQELESRQIIAKTPVYVNIIKKAVKLGRVDSTVLLLGESGTGKGVIADLIHKYSERADQPIIKLNCGSIPDSLVESELFGYEKGAFSGANRSGKPGKFEMADKGIIFLDEIGELPLNSQVKILRFLEDSVINRVGGTTGRKVDVRIIAATNQDLKEMILHNKFRSDLYYRLNVVPMTIPPLRKRQDCILPMLNAYMDKFSKKYKKEKKVVLTSRVVDVLTVYSYPGNVRELMNICERLVVMSKKGRVNYEDLPSSVLTTMGEERSDLERWEEGLTLQQMVEGFEKRVLVKAMEKYGTQARVAEKLGLNQSTVARKLKKGGTLPV